MGPLIAVPALSAVLALGAAEREARATILQLVPLTGR